jgi:translocator protein
MKLRHILNLLAVLLTIAVNAIAETVPLNGVTSKQISDSFPALFVPAGYVFAIWSLIYLGLVAFAVYQALPAHRSDPRLAAITPWFLASCLFNSAWILLWHYGLYPMTMLLMLALLGSLVVIYLMLEIGQRPPAGVGEMLAVNGTFSLYLGWISVATIANFSDLLYWLGFRGGPYGQAPWAIALLVVATVLGILMIFRRHEIVYPLVLVWAFIGIMLQQAATPGVALAAGVCAMLLALVLLAHQVQRVLQIRHDQTANRM